MLLNRASHICVINFGTGYEVSVNLSDNKVAFSFFFFFFFFVSRTSHLLLTGNIRNSSWDSGFRKTQFGEHRHVCSTDYSVLWSIFRERDIVDLLKKMKTIWAYYMLGSLNSEKKSKFPNNLEFQSAERKSYQTTNENKANCKMWERYIQTFQVCSWKWNVYFGSIVLRKIKDFLKDILIYRNTTDIDQWTF